MSEAVWVSCPGSCGELFQCVVGKGECLLSYGINRRSYARVQAESGGLLPRYEEKVATALGYLPALEAGWRIEKRSSLSIGKGLSSSTADMVACLQAQALFQGEPLSAAELTKICSQVEATDSVAFDKWTVINPLTGEVIFQTDWQPELYVYILEPRKTEWTADLTRMTDTAHYPCLQSASLLEDFKQACDLKSLNLLGQLASKSALFNNIRLPKPYLEEILSLVEDYQLLGVNVAHSGTVVGILFTKEDLKKLPLVEAQFINSSMGNYYDQRYLSKICFDGVRVH